MTKLSDLLNYAVSNEGDITGLSDGEKMALECLSKGRVHMAASFDAIDVEPEEEIRLMALNREPLEGRQDFVQLIAALRLEGF